MFSIPRSKRIALSFTIVAWNVCLAVTRSVPIGRLKVCQCFRVHPSNSARFLGPPQPYSSGWSRVIIILIPGISSREDTINESSDCGNWASTREYISGVLRFFADCSCGYSFWLQWWWWRRREIPSDNHKAVRRECEMCCSLEWHPLGQLRSLLRSFRCVDSYI